VNAFGPLPILGKWNPLNLDKASLCFKMFGREETGDQAKGIRATGSGP